MNFEEIQICVLAQKLIELAEVTGAASIKDLPGAWEHRVDDRWYVAANGHSTPVRVEPLNAMAWDLPPYTFGVWFNGWFAGEFTPMGGYMAAGETANEDALIAALDKAISNIVT